MLFKSFRVGFPTAKLHVHKNCFCNDEQEAAIDAHVARLGGETFPDFDTIHHTWIEGIVTREREPFFVCDTDVTFFGKVEDTPLDGQPMVGRLVPEFTDDFTKCITLPRLHTSLLLIDPDEVRKRIADYYGQFPKTPFNPFPNLVNPGFIPTRNGRTVKNYFYDTCCLLYQAIGGRAFTAQELDQYGHLNFGTISDLVAPHYPHDHFREHHFYAFENPGVLKGQWRKDDVWYAARKP